MSPTELDPVVRRTNEGITSDGREAFVSYEVMGWTVTLRSAFGEPWNGAGELSVRVTDVPGVESAVESDGLTFEVLRAIPLADARKRLTMLKRSQRSSQTPERGSDRLDTPEAWARFAEAYVNLVQRGHRHPIEELRSEYGGMSRNTLSARVRRARERGYLDGPPGKPANELGPEALKHLSEKEQ